MSSTKNAYEMPAAPSQRQSKSDLAKAIASTPFRTGLLGRNWLQGFKQPIERLANLLFLERCRICRQPFEPTVGAVAEACRTVCCTCWLPILAERPSLRMLQLSQGSTLKVASGTLYTGQLKRLVYRLKYYNDRSVALDLALLLQGAWSLLREELDGRAVVLVPVPLHKQRQSVRGFNQAELLTRRLAKTLGLRVDSRALLRIKETSAQPGLGRAERLSNLKGAFRCERRRVDNLTIVLVDDVCTSGATLTEAARAILSSGAREVLALTVARATLRGISRGN